MYSVVQDKLMGVRRNFRMGGQDQKETPTPVKTKKAPHIEKKSMKRPPHGEKNHPPPSPH